MMVMIVVMMATTTVPVKPETLRRLRSYRFYRFVPSKVKILDEATFGGAVFVEARVRKTRAP